MSHRVVLAANAGRPAEYPADGLPEVAFAGRSNVGKSSLINALLDRRRFARTSNTPGRTQRLHFYRVDDRYYLVDLPGYGFAKVPIEVRRAWGPMVRTYLSTRGPLVGVVQVVDLRHPPSREDCQLADWLAEYRIRHWVVATKADKISRGQWPAHLATMAKGLGLDAAAAAERLFAVSAVQRDNIAAVAATIAAATAGGMPWPPTHPQE
ncbi:MAG: YihA family ribosome biogenesis GTP-binding protein [Deltaproteobacteria bacterium]|nr:YihA family ribosome biogenesis GTP-binding protein [Deltaproteobacteria bacterium]NCS74487.1 YihA family ribosome biogenesis GTP-binding protein [Deltaproteobacteria bacterium]PIX84233.1 MAG: YihA family ribosome biogenesis GTP-binding protein [Nitrospirae bacterium CG_4_10_14_3_um_filter_70_108]PJB94762.1 MAG: YihA family ribosome biogenesis GTP-binding protein [Nitrospirae bacterium CG_4_9_14_0_8_um_filter_70_14]HBB41279.1 YihA family ribosome biogenesis GTP-binding protein [Pseudomonadot